MFNKLHMKEFLMSTNKLRGVYNGTVVSASDPDSLSRVRVSIPGLTEGIQDDHLPWYVVQSPPSSSPNSRASIPPEGSEVVVDFPTDDIYNGRVVYQIVSKPPL